MTDKNLSKVNYQLQVEKLYIEGFLIEQCKIGEEVWKEKTGPFNWRTYNYRIKEDDNIVVKDNVIWQILEDERCVWCYVKACGCLYKGLSICRRDDIWNVEKGKDISKLRAIIQLKKDQLWAMKSIIADLSAYNHITYDITTPSKYGKTFTKKYKNTLINKLYVDCQYCNKTLNKLEKKLAKLVYEE